MKAKILVEKEVEIKTLLVHAGVRYYEDGEVNGVKDTNGYLIPCKNGELWCPEIDIDNGVIINWKQGVKAKVHYKVCDAGSYFLKDENGNIILSIDEDYVPSILCPKDNSFGDYIIMDIDENGKIDGWKIDISDFLKDND